MEKLVYEIPSIQRKQDAIDYINEYGFAIENDIKNILM